MNAEEHQELMAAAIEYDRIAQQALFAGDVEMARISFAQASDLYRGSWEAAPAGSYGRLVGMLKSGVLAGGGQEEAVYAMRQLGDQQAPSAPAAYAHTLAALISGDDAEARRWCERMRGGSEPFDRAADAIEALAAHDQERYREAVSAIVRDFEQRKEHLTKIAIADTALMLEHLAARRGMAAQLESPVLPAA